MLSYTTASSLQNNAALVSGMKSGKPLVITRPNPEAAPGNAEAAVETGTYQETSGSAVVALDAI